MLLATDNFFFTLTTDKLSRPTVDGDQSSVFADTAYHSCNVFLIIGGCGRIGGSNRPRHSGRIPMRRSPLRGATRKWAWRALERLGAKVQFQVLDLASAQQLKNAVAKGRSGGACGGGGLFTTVQADVLKTCISQGINYVDVSDGRSFTRKAPGPARPG